jgi:hypothetical protein
MDIPCVQVRMQARSPGEPSMVTRHSKHDPIAHSAARGDAARRVGMIEAEFQIAAATVHDAGTRSAWPLMVMSTV